LRFSSFVIENVVVAIEAEQGTKDGGVEKFDNRVKFIDPVFDGGASEDKRVATIESFDGAGSERCPIFNPLGFIEDHDVGFECCVDIERIGADLFVVDDGEKGSRVFVDVDALAAGAINHFAGECCEFLDLLLPFGLQGSGGDDEASLGFSESVQESGGGNPLDCFSKTHFISY